MLAGPGDRAEVERLVAEAVAVVEEEDVAIGEDVELEGGAAAGERVAAGEREDELVLADRRVLEVADLGLEREEAGVELPGADPPAERLGPLLAPAGLGPGKARRSPGSRSGRR